MHGALIRDFTPYYYYKSIAKAQTDWRHEISFGKSAKGIIKSQ